jgi:hypothetical protein
MAQRLRITELDFDTIKTNLKNYLQSQSEFTDYDFDGAGLSYLLDILAYNTHYQAYYLNMVANESFMDTAITRDSVVSNAKNLGYVPKSRSATKAQVTITIDTGNTTPDQLTLPRGTVFLSNLIDGKAYNFITIEDIVISKSNTSFIFDTVDIYEGNITSTTFVQNNLSNPKQIFTLPDSNIDTSTLLVTVTDVSSNTASEVYTLVTDATELSTTSPVYYLQEGLGGLYQIYFGGDNVGKSIPDGSTVSVSYLVTNAYAADSASSFVGMSPIGIYPSYTVTTVTNAAGGAEKESLDSIKQSAPLSFASQNRLITTNDYKALLQQQYPQASSVSVWGGQEQTPKVYGKVFASIKPKTGYYLSETEKQRIINDIITPKSILSVKTEIIDPSYTYLKLQIDVRYDKNKTNLAVDTIKNSIRLVVLNYKLTNLDKFDGQFNTSSLVEGILAIDKSIVACDINVRLSKKVEPTLNVNRSYTIDFKNKLLRGSIDSQLQSDEFYVLDAGNTQRTVNLEEVPQSYTGIETITVTNPGYNYTDIPTVTISGDGTGATAVATIVNGKITKITVTNRGIGYTRAAITISGTGNSGAAIPLITAKTGILQTYYFDSNLNKQIVNSQAGTINYDTGVVQLENINIKGVNSSDDNLNISIETADHYLTTHQEQILTIDQNDAASIEINVSEI